MSRFVRNPATSLSSAIPINYACLFRMIATVTPARYIDSLGDNVKQFFELIINILEYYTLLS